jgi:ankyrin repeat protein
MENENNNGNENENEVSLEDQLHDAVESGNLPEVKRLLAAGADPNSSENNFERPLIFLAIQEENLTILKAFIAAHADLNIMSSEGTPLMWATTFDQPKMVNALLKAGADPNRQLIYDWPEDVPRDTALACAINDENINIMNILLQGGANVNMRNANGEYPIEFAIQEGGIDTVRVLLNYHTRKKLAIPNIKQLIRDAIEGEFDPEINELILKPYQGRFNAEIALQLRPGLEPKTNEGAKGLRGFAMNRHLLDPILNFAYPKYPKNGGRRRHSKTKKRISRRRKRTMKRRA